MNCMEVNAKCYSDITTSKRLSINTFYCYMSNERKTQVEKNYNKGITLILIVTEAFCMSIDIDSVNRLTLRGIIDLKDYKLPLTKIVQHTGGIRDLENQYAAIVWRVAIMGSAKWLLTS